MNALEIAIELDARDQDITVDQLNAFCDDLSTYTVLGKLNVILHEGHLVGIETKLNSTDRWSGLSTRKANNLSDRINKALRAAGIATKSHGWNTIGL